MAWCDDDVRVSSIGALHSSSEVQNLSSGNLGMRRK